MVRRVVFVAPLMVGLLVFAGCTLLAPAQPTLEFEASSVDGTTPFVVLFTPTADVSFTSFEWNFGDGATSTERQPVHIYRAAGSYTVTVTASSAAGETIAARKADYVLVADGAAEAGDLYWVAVTGQLFRAVTDGTAYGPAGLNVPASSVLAIDDAFLYWGVEPTGMLYSAPIGGTQPHVILKGIRGLGGVAVDSAAAKIYWTTRPASAGCCGRRYDGTVKRANVDGSGVETMASFVPDATHMPNHIALDPVSRTLYWEMVPNPWSARPLPSDCLGEVWSAELDDFQAEKLLDGICPSNGMALDTLDVVGAQNVYLSLDSGAILRCSLDDPTDREVIVEGIDDLLSLGVDRLRDKAYFISAAGIERIRLDGAERRVLYDFGSPVELILAP